MALKTVIGLQVVLVVVPLAGALGRAELLSILGGVLAITAFVALWNMKRWAVVVLGLNVLSSALVTTPHYLATTPRALPIALGVAALLFGLKNVSFFVALPFWRRMTWR